MTINEGILFQTESVILMTSFVGFLFLSLSPSLPRSLSFVCLRQLTLDNISFSVLLLLVRSFSVFFLFFFLAAPSVCVCVIIYVCSFVCVRATDRTKLQHNHHRNWRRTRRRGEKARKRMLGCLLNLDLTSIHTSTAPIGQDSIRTEPTTPLTFYFRYLSVSSYQILFSKANISRSRSLLKVE